MQSELRRKGVLNIIFFSWANNVWFGICTLIAIFIYSSLGSAIPVLRQHPLLEMTEMEWFHWWPFKLLFASLCINVTTVTIKQIPLRWVNAGVWSIHTGIIILAMGSAYYFSTKLEGDIPVFRRKAVIAIPGHTQPVSMLVRPDNHIVVGSGSDAYHFSISQIFPDWRIASGDDKGKTAYMVWIDVVTPQQRFTRQLLAGYPQYTEDILPDRTRAKKTLGKPLVDQALVMTLDYQPQDEFYLMDSAALYVRNLGSEAWFGRPINGLPHYHERISSYEDVFMPAGNDSIPLRPIDRPVPPRDSQDPLSGYRVRVTSFLRYAFMASKWRDGGGRLNPVADVALIAPSGSRVDYELVAFDSDHNSAENGLIVFRWIESSVELERMAASSEARLIFRVPGSDATVEVPIASDFQGGHDDDPFIPIEETEFSYRIKSVVYDLPMKSGRFAGRSISVATVEIKTPQKTLTRFVADKPGATRDVSDKGSTVDPDPAVETRFDPGLRAIITLVAGPPDVGTHTFILGEDGAVQQHTLSPGQSKPVRGGWSFSFDRLRTHAVRDVRPRVVPRSQRQRNARETFSMIRVDVSKGNWSATKWLAFNRYAFPNEQYAVPGRLSYHPSSVELPGGGVVELMFSRDRRPLPAPIALEAFELATHTGGYTGETITILDFISTLRFKTDEGWSQTVQMSSNQPANWGGFWYFQSEWDPPSQGHAGMNYTGLGVGNRNGVHIQLAGTCIAVSGMIFAFYIKPIIRRKMKRSVRSRAGAADTKPPVDSPVENMQPEPVAST